jgi:hypothetical protein
MTSRLCTYHTLKDEYREQVALEAQRRVARQRPLAESTLLRLQAQLGSIEAYHAWVDANLTDTDTWAEIRNKALAALGEQ